MAFGRPYDEKGVLGAQKFNFLLKWSNLLADAEHADVMVAEATISSSFVAMAAAYHSGTKLRRRILNKIPEYV